MAVLGQTDLTFHLTLPSILAVLGEMFDQFDHQSIAFHLEFYRTYSESLDSVDSDRDSAGRVQRTMFDRVVEQIKHFA